ncbi:MAG: SLC13 family permease [Desulfobacteraceae bacterium]|nr:MAG: SLC13 family permease [Desulfobacteraceae bacterium]
MIGVEAAAVLAILAAAVLLFITDWVSADVVAILSLLSLVLTGILTPEEAFSGFSNSAVIAIGGLLMISTGLVRTGVVKWLAHRLGAWAGESYPRLVIASTTAPGILSGFISIVAAVSIFIPALLRMARRSRRAEARDLLLPMALCGLAGSNLSLIGASHNLVVNSLLKQETGKSLGFFEFAPIGAVLLVSIVAYSLLFRKILRRGESGPRDKAPWDPIGDLVRRYHLNERLWEVQVTRNSPVCCKTIGQIGLGREYGLSCLLVLRAGKQLPVESQDFEIRPDDVLAVAGRRNQVENFTGKHEGLVLMGQPAAEEEFTWSVFELAEIVVPPNSPLEGKTLREADFRHRTGVVAVALWRDNRPIRTGIGDIQLRAGDGLLLFGTKSHVRSLEPRPDFLWLQKPRKEESIPALHRLAPPAALVFILVVVSAAFNWVSLAVAALAGAAAMVLMGALTPRAAYRQIDWRTLVLIGGMYPVGTALQKTGAAGEIADLIVRLLGTLHPSWSLLAIGLLALLLTQPMHNAVAAVILTPVAIQVAQHLDANPKSFAIAVLIGASASFLMPVGHPAVLFVKEPGRYRNGDYLRFGLVPALLVLAVITGLIPLLWPVRG